MPDTQVILGPITLQDFEIPSAIPFGGEQMLVVHKFIGGARQIDTMGPDPRPIRWEGRFRGQNAKPRAKALDRLRQLGQEITLSWGGETRQVVIKSFLPLYERGYEIPYEITLEVLSGEAQQKDLSLSPLTSLLGGDIGGIGGLISSVQSSVSGVFSDLAPLLSTVQSNLAGAGTLLNGIAAVTGLKPGITSGLLSNLDSANIGINGALQIADGHIFSGAGAIGGVLAGSSPQNSGVNLNNKVLAMQAVSNLVVARGYTGRAITNTLNAGAAS